MATKAIYTNIDGTYYKVNQPTTNPSEVVRMHKTHSQMNNDATGKIVNSSIWVNALDVESVFTNKELYNKMIAHIEKNKIKEIKSIQNHYVMYCDYSVYNYEGKEINHNAFARPLKPYDAIYNLGVDAECELVYKQVKVFESNIALNVKNEYPMGIMRNESKVKYTLQINDISIYQDIVYDESDIHKSSDPNSYPISTILETMEKIYSTHDNGITIGAVEVPYIPRKIILDMNITLDNMIVVYDDLDVTKVINKNNGIEEPEDGSITIIFNGGSATK